MSHSGPGAAFSFLIDTLFNFYCYIVLARFLLQIFKADFYNPVSQFVVKATNPILIPLRRIIPGFGGLDIAAIFVLILLQFIKVSILVFIKINSLGDPLALLLFTLKECAGMVLDFFTFAIIIQVILSWVSQGYHPIAGVLQSLTEPLLGPVRRMMPSMGGFDFSPIVVLFGISFFRILIGL